MNNNYKAQISFQSMTSYITSLNNQQPRDMGRLGLSYFTGKEEKMQNPRKSS